MAQMNSTVNHLGLIDITEHYTLQFFSNVHSAFTKIDCTWAIKQVSVNVKGLK